MIEGSSLETECGALWEALHSSLPFPVLLPFPGVLSPSRSLSELVLEDASQAHHPGTASRTPIRLWHLPQCLTKSAKQNCTVFLITIFELKSFTLFWPENS